MNNTSHLVFINNKKYILGIVMIGTFLTFVYSLATPYMTLASIAYIFLVVGIFFRHHRKIHIPLMGLGMLLDLTLVGILELQRSAIATAVNSWSGSLNGFQIGHIVASLIAVILYFPTIFFGIKSALRKSTDPKNNTHLQLGRAAFIFRTVGFVLMFSLLDYLQRK